MDKIRISSGSSFSAISKIVEIDRTKSATGFIDDMKVGDTVQPSLIKLQDEDCYALYRGNEHIMAVINRITRDCVKVKLRIVPKDPNTKITSAIKRRIDIITKFLENPNENKESFTDIREKVIRDLLVCGRGVVEKVIDRSISEIYAQNPKGIRINSDQHGTLAKTKTYKLIPTIAAEPVYWDFDELIYMVLNPVSNSHYGVKILDGIANTVAADILRAVHNSNYFLNGAEASGLLGLEGMSDKNLEKFRSYWKSNFKGAKNSHKTAAVNVPVKYVRMAITNRDLEFNEYGKELRGKIYSAYGMQPVVMGMVDGTTGKLNTSEQIELYKDGALRPILSKESYYYTMEIINMGFGFDDIMIEFPSLDFIDIATQSATDIAEAAAGIRTINEIRLRRGDPKVTWGDTPISVMPGGGQVDPNTGRLMPPTQKPKPSGTAPRAKSVFDKFINSVKNKLDVILDSYKDKKLVCDELKKNIVFKTIRVGDYEFELSYYKLPDEIINTKEYGVIDSMLNVDEFCGKDDQTKHRYLKSISSRIKYVIFRSLKKGKFSKALRQIDSIFQEEIKSNLYKEIFE